MKNRLFVMILVIALLNSGCLHYKTFVGPVAAEQPVLVGKIRKIGDKTKMVEPAKVKSRFRIQKTQGEAGFHILQAPFGSDYHGGVNELQSIEKDIAREDLIAIKNADFGSHFLYGIPIPILLSIITAGNWTGIQGVVYEGKARPAGADSK